MRAFASRVKTWVAGERGQDLSEYCLLTALLALIALGIFLQASGGLKSLWTSANTTLHSGTSGQTSSAGSHPASQ